MAKNTGKRKHWSQHALAGAGAAIGVGRKVRQRVRRAVIRGGKRVINRLRRKTGGLRRRKTDILGTFVKCKDWKPKAFGKRSKKFQSFARKVNSVVYSELPRATELYSYAWEAANTPVGPNSYVKWMQFCLDPLQAASGSNNAGNSQISVGSYANLTNPAGMTTILRQENVFGISTASATGPTVLSSTFDKQQDGGTPVVDARREVMWRQNASTMTIQFKNIKSYGLTLEVMLVKPKKAIQGSMYKLQTSGWQTDAAVPTFATHPQGWSATSPMGMTPLEMAEIGLARVSGINNLHLWTNPMLSLNDSTDFNDFYKITHKCKVYLPPGGVVEKSIRHGSSRLLKMAHVTENLYDTRTTFMVVKYVPEVQLLANNADSSLLGAGVPAGTVESGTSTDLVGTINYRMGYKQTYGATAVASLGQYNRQVISTNIQAGQPTSVHTKAP
jgi:hypothetical protein